MGHCRVISAMREINMIMEVVLLTVPGLGWEKSYAFVWPWECMPSLGKLAIQKTVRERLTTH